MLIVTEICMEMKNKKFKYIYLITKCIYLMIIYIPIILNYIVFYSYVCRAIKRIGHIPTYNNPDPKDIIGLDFHRQLIYDLGNLLIITLIAMFVGFILSFVLKGKFFKEFRIHYLITFILIVYYFINPLMEWFLD